MKPLLEAKAGVSRKGIEKGEPEDWGFCPKGLPPLVTVCSRKRGFWLCAGGAGCSVGTCDWSSWLSGSKPAGRAGLHNKDLSRVTLGQGSHSKAAPLLSSLTQTSGCFHHNRKSKKQKLAWGVGGGI